MGAGVGGGIGAEDEEEVAEDGGRLDHAEVHQVGKGVDAEDRRCAVGGVLEEFGWVGLGNTGFG